MDLNNNPPDMVNCVEKKRKIEIKDNKITNLCEIRKRNEIFPYYKNEFTDICIKVNGKNFYVIKKQICSYSDYFKIIFENGNNEIELNETVENFKTLLDVFIPFNRKDITLQNYLVINVFEMVKTLISTYFLWIWPWTDGEHSFDFAQSVHKSNKKNEAAQITTYLFDANDLDKTKTLCKFYIDKKNRKIDDLLQALIIF